MHCIFELHCGHCSSYTFALCDQERRRGCNICADGRFNGRILNLLNIKGRMDTTNIRGMTDGGVALLKELVKIIIVHAHYTVMFPLPLWKGGQRFLFKSAERLKSQPCANVQLITYTPKVQRSLQLSVCVCVLNIH